MKKIFMLLFPLFLFALCSGFMILYSGNAHSYTLKKGGYWRDIESGSVSVMGGKFTMPFHKTFFVCQNNKNSRPYTPPVKPHCKFKEHGKGSNTIVYSMVCSNPKGVMKSNGVTKILSQVSFVSKIKTVFTGTTGNAEVSNFTINGYRVGNTCK